MNTLTPVEGHEILPEGKTLRDWAYRAHCSKDREPWPCRTVLLATLAARPDLTTIASEMWAESQANDIIIECAGRLQRYALRISALADVGGKPKSKRIDWSDVVVDEGDEAP